MEATRPEATGRRPSLAYLAATVLVGACLVTPGPALATSAVSQETEDVAVSSTPVDGTASQESAVYSFGGVQVAVPDGFHIVDLGFAMLAGSADGSVVVSIAPSDADASVPEDSSQWETYFSAGTASVGMEVPSFEGEVLDLSDGTQAYAVSLAAEQGGSQISISCIFVPLDDGTYTLVQVAWDAQDGDADAMARSIAASVVRATGDARSLDPSAQGISTPADSQTVESGGIAFTLPSDYAADEGSSTDDPTWHSADNTVMVGILPNLIAGYTGLGKNVFDMIAVGIAKDLGGTVGGNATLSNDGTDVDAYVFTFSSEGVGFVGVLGMVVLPDDTVTGVLALSPMDGAAGNDRDVAALFDSIRLAD